MKMNPVYSIRSAKKPLVFLHNHSVSKELLDRVIEERKSIEVDVNYSSDRGYYIGHHPSFYKYYSIPRPESLSLAEVMEHLTTSDVFVKFDCKDRKVLPKVQELAREIGPRRCMLHAFVDELYIKNGQVIDVEYWRTERIPFKEILELKKKAGNPPLEVSARGITVEIIKNSSETLMESIGSAIEKKAEVVNLNINEPNHALPPDEFLEKFYLRNGVLTEVYIEKLDGRKLKVPYFGSTDDLALATPLYTT
ncbi:hypothetical protein HYT33_02300 [Candidatus Roizmanbacteria bacterium]|nr:hypothetical protein [Candidatus Roizmanbacteria bacterium]